MKLHYSDENGNKIYIPEEIELQPIGEVIFTFKGKDSILTIGKNVRLTRCKFTLANNCSIKIGDNCTIKGDLLAQHFSSHIMINDKCKFNGVTRIHAAEGCTIRIGKGCLFSNVRFRTSDSHSIIDLDTKKRINLAQDIIIEDCVWIAENVYIYKGVTVGTGSVIGARSTVTRDLPSHSLCIGTPAKAIKSNISWQDKLI